MKPREDNKLETYEDPEKAAAEPMVARTTTAENFMITIYTGQVCEKE
jgi:hypothetical protein